MNSQNEKGQMPLHHFLVEICHCEIFEGERQQDLLYGMKEFAKPKMWTEYTCGGFMKLNISFAVGMVFLILLPSAWAGSSQVDKVGCTAIREEPGAPTVAFELVRRGSSLYEARYLSLPGDESAPPEIIASIPGLSCRFLSSNSFFFQCQKLGASVESVDISERELNLIADEIRIQRFKEFRAVGNEVPGVFLPFRFGSADTCVVE